MVALLTLATGFPIASAAAVPASSSSAADNVWTDVPDGYWAKGAIDLVASTNTWMQDYGPTTFQPDGVETRRFLARALVEAFAPTATPKASLTFADLPPDDPFFPYANVAVKKHWMLRTGDSFRPDAPVTTQSLHRALVKAIGFGDLAAGIEAIHTSDGYVFQHKPGVGVLMMGMLLALRYNHSDPSLDVGPKTPLPRSEVAWSLYRAWTIDTSESWLHDYYAGYGTITLPPLSDEMRQVVEFGLKYVGFPYVYAGEWYRQSPVGYCCGSQPVGGFDCSGFTWWLMKAPDGGWDNTEVRGYTGWPLPERSSSDMSKAVAPTERIAYDDLQPGDLMFYSSGGSSVDHVDTYLGGGWSFDSSNGYAGVQIMNVAAGWYHDHFMWGRRIVTEATAP
ncbi:MAG: NlpC/P60 family protein [Actinomycetota bacterium]|nr:NlpC/P60 family protein [Actinomycetota bacterium]